MPALPLQSLLYNFKGINRPENRGFLPKDEAYELLKYHTGQDFGDAFEKWQQWIDEHPRSIHDKDLSNVDSLILRRRREWRKKRDSESS